MILQWHGRSRPAVGEFETLANWNDPTPASRARPAGFGASPGLSGAVGGSAVFDAGLRRYMLSIYNTMASGVLLSGIVALVF
ncbi:hypothetical protein ABTK06_19055, partial [Acinetobacter baumannii]